MAYDIDKLVDVAMDNGAMDDMTAFKVTRMLDKKNERKWLVAFATQVTENHGSLLHVVRTYYKQLKEAGMEPKAIYQLQDEYVKERKEEAKA